MEQPVIDLSHKELRIGAFYDLVHLNADGAKALAGVITRLLHEKTENILKQ